MPDRHIPVRPDLERLKREAAELGPGADGREALARAYGLPSWQRLERVCRLTGTIWRGDAAAVRALIESRPEFLHEDARGVEGNWGPPMSYAANLGQDGIVEMLHGMGARDLDHAFDRACLQGRVATARRLHALGVRPARDAVMGPAETQSGSGMAFLLELGAAISDAKGDRLAPVALVLETYCRNPEGKHRCLELFAEHGVEDESEHEYRDVTPRAWGERFHDPSWAHRPALELIAERGGRA